MTDRIPLCIPLHAFGRASLLVGALGEAMEERAVPLETAFKDVLRKVPTDQPIEPAVDRQRGWCPRNDGLALHESEFSENVFFAY